MNCTGPKSAAQIWIACPEATKIAFELPEALWGAGWLRLFVRPERYTPLVQNEGSRYAGGTLLVRRVQKGIELDVKAQQVNVLGCIQQIARTSECNERNRHTFIQLRDYVQPEVDDVAIALAQNTIPYTTRYGQIPLDLIRSSGLIPTGDTTMPILRDGFKFTFFEYHFR